MMATGAVPRPQGHRRPQASLLGLWEGPAARGPSPEAGEGHSRPPGQGQALGSWRGHSLRKPGRSQSLADHGGHGPPKFTSPRRVWSGTPGHAGSGGRPNALAEAAVPAGPRWVSRSVTPTGSVGCQAHRRCLTDVCWTELLAQSQGGVCPLPPGTGSPPPWEGPPPGYSLQGKPETRPWSRGRGWGRQPGADRAGRGARCNWGVCFTRGAPPPPMSSEHPQQSCVPPARL